MPFQATRIFEVKTPLGEDVLLLRRMRVRERLSSPFEIDIELLSDNASIASKDILGLDMTVRVALPGEQTRYFHGHVTAFGAAGREGRYARYRAKLRPWL